MTKQKPPRFKLQQKGSVPQIIQALVALHEKSTLALQSCVLYAAYIIKAHHFLLQRTSG